MAILTTLCYIEKDDKYLMLHRTKKQNDLNHEKWIGVGGKFEKDESPEECLKREVKEETGVEITNLELICNIPNSYIYSGMDQHPLDFYFTAKIKESQTLKPQEGETSHLRFISLDKIAPESFAMKSTRLFLKNLLENKVKIP